MKWPFVSRARLERELAKQKHLHDQDFALVENGVGAALQAEREAHAATKAELGRVRADLARIDALTAPLLPCSICDADYGEEHRLGCRVRMQPAPGEEAPRG